MSTPIYMSRCQHQYILLITCIYTFNANIQCNIQSKSMQLTATTHRPLQTCWQIKYTGAVTQRRGTNFASSRRTGCTCPALFSSSHPCPALFRSSHPCPALFSSRLPPVQCCPGQRRPTLTPQPDLLTEADERCATGGIKSVPAPGPYGADVPSHSRAIHFYLNKFRVQKLNSVTPAFDPEGSEERRKVTSEKKTFEESTAVNLHFSCHLINLLNPHFLRHQYFSSTLIVCTKNHWKRIFFLG